MRDLFAIEDPEADPSYTNTRTPRHEGAQRARANCEELWAEFEPLPNQHFLDEFPYRFHQRWFEMYLAVALLRSGLDVTYCDDGMPDLLVRQGGRRLWIEATAPTGGDVSNPDHVAHPMPRNEDGIPVAYTVPTERIILRVRGALYDKAKQILGYRKRGVIGPDDQVIVALNVRDIPHGFFDPDKYGLGAVYGRGDPYMVLEVPRLGSERSVKMVDSGYAQRFVVVRASGNSVEMEPFLRPGHEHVSAALMSGLDAANCSGMLGSDFLLLPNPNAAPLYASGQIKLGREWRLTNAAEAGAYNVEVIGYS